MGTAGRSPDEGMSSGFEWSRAPKSLGLKVFGSGIRSNSGGFRDFRASCDVRVLPRGIRGPLRQEFRDSGLRMRVWGGEAFVSRLASFKCLFLVF